MSKVDVVFGGKTYTLTDEHPASSYGQPVLVDQSGKAYGPYELVGHAVDFGVLAISSTARAVAGYIRDDQPNNADAIKLLDKFNAIPMVYVLIP